MKSMNKGQFKPTDLFDDNEDDEEDRIYLAEYNLDNEKKRKQE